MTSFSTKILSSLISVGKDELIPVIYDFNMRRYFLTWYTLLYIECFEQEINVDDDITEDLRIFLISDFLSTFDTYF